LFLSALGVNDDYFLKLAEKSIKKIEAESLRKLFDSKNKIPIVEIKNHEV
jgi:hypothetical protein